MLEGFIYFSVRSLTDFEENLEELIGLIPTHKIEKGDRISSVRNASFFLWGYRKEYKNQNELVRVLSEIAETIKIKANNIIFLSNKYENVSIRICITSESWEVGFSLSSKTIALFGNLGVDLEIELIFIG